MTARGYFDEAVEDDEEFREIGGNNSANDIFLTLATDFRTEAPDLEHRFRNLARPNCDAGIEVLVVDLKLCPFAVESCAMVSEVDAPEGSSFDC